MTAMGHPLLVFFHSPQSLPEDTSPFPQSAGQCNYICWFVWLLFKSSVSLGSFSSSGALMSNVSCVSIRSPDDCFSLWGTLRFTATLMTMIHHGRFSKRNKGNLFPCSSPLRGLSFDSSFDSHQESRIT